MPQRPPFSFRNASTVRKRNLKPGSSAPVRSPPDPAECAALTASGCSAATRCMTCKRFGGGDITGPRDVPARVVNLAVTDQGLTTGPYEVLEATARARQKYDIFGCKASPRRILVSRPLPPCIFASPTMASVKPPSNATSIRITRLPTSPSTSPLRTTKTGRVPTSTPLGAVGCGAPSL